MKIYLLILLLGFALHTVFGQLKSNSTEIKTRTNSFIRLNPGVSMNPTNYQRMLPSHPQFVTNHKLVAGYNPLFSLRTFGEENYITFPQQMTTNFGKGINFFEFGMGGTYIPENRFGHSNFYYPILGFRIQPQTASKFILRIFGSYPFSGKFIEGAQYLPLGLSVGFVVK
jgi:hypothetical protein